MKSDVVVVVVVVAIGVVSLLTRGMKVMTLYFWFRMTLGGNFCTVSLPTQTVRAENSLRRQQHRRQKGSLMGIKNEGHLAMRRYTYVLQHC